MFELIYWIVIAIVLFFWIIFIWTTIRGAPWYPIDRNIARKMLKMAKVQKGDVVYDLGSGDGRLLIEAAKLGAKSIGIEINPLSVWQSKYKIKKLGLQNKIEIIQDSFWKHDLAKADVVCIFLTQLAVNKLKAKLEREIKKGSRVVTHCWQVPDWRAVASDHENRIWVYEM